MNFTFNGQDYYLKTDINDKCILTPAITLGDYCDIIDIFSKRERNPLYDELVINLNIH